MGGVTREQRNRLQTIDSELSDVRQRLGKLYNLVETTDMEVDDFKPRIRELRERQDRLENSAEEARAALAQRRKVLDDVNAIAAYAKEMKDFLEESELTERRAFIETFVKEILVVPGDALMSYTVPMPDDSRAPGKATEKVALPGALLSYRARWWTGLDSTPFHLVPRHLRRQADDWRVRGAEGQALRHPQPAPEHDPHGHPHRVDRVCGYQRRGLLRSEVVGGFWGFLAMPPPIRGSLKSASSKAP